MKTTKNKKPDFSLILPCYNEGPHLDESVKKIVETLAISKFSYEIILIDDKSKDNTAQHIKNIVKNHQHLQGFFHKKNLGRGGTVKKGILKAKGKVVGFIDVDLEVSPVYIPYFVSRILNGQAEVTTGHRTYRETLISLPRVISSRSYSFLVKKILGVPLHDTETGYKFFDRQKILPILKKTRNPGWFWDTEIMTIAYYQGLKIKELPVLFTRRFDKQSTVRIIPDALDYFVNLCCFRQRVKKGFQ